MNEKISKSLKTATILSISLLVLVIATMVLIILATSVAYYLTGSRGFSEAAGLFSVLFVAIFLCSYFFDS